MKNKNLLSEINRMKELAGIITESKGILNEVDASVMGGIAKNLYLYLSKMKVNNPLDINGAPLKNVKGEVITNSSKVKMSYQNSSSGMDKLAMQGKAKELGGKAIQGSEVSLNYSLDQIYALGFVKKEEADAALQEILKKYPQVIGSVKTNKMDYEWAKDYAPTYSITINMKSDKEIAKGQSAKPIAQVPELNEEANTDLELKSVARQIFSVLKKYNLKPVYELDGKQYMSKTPATGYGARIVLDNNGVLTVAVYDRGLWDTLKNENIHELDMGNVSYPSPEERKQIEQKAGNIYKDIVSTLGQNNFDIRNNIKPDKYGNYVIQIRKKEQPAQQKPAQQQQPIQQPMQKAAE